MDDPWTVRFNDFKQNRGQSVYKAEAVVRAAARSLFRRFDIDPEDTAVVPALRSSETRANANSHNSRLARALAEGAGAHCQVHCLSKNRHEKLHFQPTQGLRDFALAAANYRAGWVGKKNVIIVDDIVTRGATMAAIAGAIVSLNPNILILGFALGRHQRREWLSEPFDEANSKIPKILAEIWDRADSDQSLPF